MIKFRQKIFFVGALLNTAMIGSTVAGLKQGSEQMKQAEAQAEEAAIQNKQLVKALNKVADNAAKNPQAATEAAQLVGQQKVFAKVNLGGLKNAWNTVKNSQTFKNTTGLVKDLGTVAYENKGVVLGGIATGGVLSGASYLTDRAIQKDMKRSGIPVPKNEKKQKNYAQVPSSLLSKESMKKIGSKVWGGIKKHKGTMITMGVLGSAPTALGYLAEKKQLKDQIASTQPKQKTYAIPLWKNIPGYVKKAREAWKNAQIRKTPGQTTLGFLSNVAGGGGRKGVQKFGQRLQELGKKNGSKYTEKLGNFIIEKPKTALVASIPVGGAVTFGAWGLGEKAVKKTAEALDDNAYAYQNSKEQQIPQQ